LILQAFKLWHPLSKSKSLYLLVQRRPLVAAGVILSWLGLLLLFCYLPAIYLMSLPETAAGKPQAARTGDIF
jgi:hypothetical protein